MIMRHSLSCLLLACTTVAGAQFGPPVPTSVPDLEQEVVQGGTAWLVGDHVEARRHFQVAAQRGSPLGQYNLAMMLLYREGGPCDAAQAIALLRKSADGGVDLAREALNQTQDGAPAANEGRERPFPCRLPRKTRFIPAGAGAQPNGR